MPEALSRTGRTLCDKEPAGAEQDGGRPEKRPRYIIGFDSCTSMLSALGRFLHGLDFPGVGVAAHIPSWAAGAANRVPRSLREAVYTVSGWAEAIPEKMLEDVQSEEISGWVCGKYPERPWPAVMLGSSNGALVHLGAALGIPWLPQTYLLACRRRMPPDLLKEDMEWGRERAAVIRKNNPELQINQMRDPLQDRLMIRLMAYFRLKRLGLGPVFENFLQSRLYPGGTMISVECQYPWPQAEAGPGHYYQVGGFGGIMPYEYINGSPRVEKFLRGQNVSHKAWDVPRIAGERPEAEWGFEPALLDDMQRFALEKGYTVRRLKFKHPEMLSPLVADLYRWWYRRRGIESSRVIVECFALMEPYWTIRTGSIPFWMAFNTERSAEALEHYLLNRGPFEEVFLMLMNNGVSGAAGLTTISRWEEILRHAKSRGEFVGVDRKKYPSDFASFIRYHSDVKKKIRRRIECPAPLSLAEFENFLEENIHRYEVEWE